MKKILILLSTYNGEKYIKEQIDSLWGQKGVDVTILVRDDGSEDGTVSILKDYGRKTEKIKLLRGDNCGSCNSFFKLMQESLKYIGSYDYYAFCDQDDVWLEDKLLSAVTVLEHYEGIACPKLYMGAYQMVDKSLNLINTPIRTPKHTLPAAFASNCATGCTMVFNAELLAAVAREYNARDVLMHDYWTYLVCLVRGGYVYYDSSPYILYRQHGDNVIGGGSTPFVKRWLLRFKKLFKSADNFKSRLASKLLQDQESVLCNGNREFLERMSTPNRLSSKIYLIKCKDFWNCGVDCTIKNLGLLLTGKI